MRRIVLDLLPYVLMHPTPTRCGFSLQAWADQTLAAAATEAAPPPLPPPTVPASALGLASLLQRAVILHADKAMALLLLALAVQVRRMSPGLSGRWRQEMDRVIHGKALGGAYLDQPKTRNASTSVPR